MSEYRLDPRIWKCRGGTTAFTTDQIRQLQFHEEGLYSMTSANAAREMNDCIAKLPFLQNLGRGIEITDGCACCGGNVMSLMCDERYRTINAVELSPETFGMLKHNVQNTKSFCPFQTKGVIVNLFVDSYLSKMDTLTQDVVMLDPPWGGIGYRQNQVEDLSLGDMSIVQIVNHLYTNRQQNLTKYVILKVPPRPHWNRAKFKRNLHADITFQPIGNFNGKFDVFVCGFYVPVVPSLCGIDSIYSVRL